jgi:hypothetical protein
MERKEKMDKYGKVIEPRTSDGTVFVDSSPRRFFVLKLITSELN